MNIEFKESTKVATTKETRIVVAGRDIGYVATYEDRPTSSYTRCHAVIELECGLLAQGHEKTAEAAVVKAVSNGRSRAIAVLEQLDEIQMELMTPVVLAPAAEVQVMVGFCSKCGKYRAFGKQRDCPVCLPAEPEKKKSVSPSN